MKLYDGESAIDWFYDGTRTAEEMKFMPEYEQLFQEPCVLQDDGDGKVYSFVTLVDLCMKLAVPYNAAPEKLFESCVASDKGTYKAPGVAEAQATADEAKAIAEQAGTDPQLQALALMQVATMDLTGSTATEVASISDFIPEWYTLIGKTLKQNDPCNYQSKLYRASQAVNVQEIYPPDIAGESQYYPIDVDTDGIIIYRTCHGEYDAVMKGELRHFPGAGDPVYKSLVDKNAYSPDVRPQDWELVQQGVV